MDLRASEMRWKGALQNNESIPYGTSVKDNYVVVSGLDDVRGVLTKKSGSRGFDTGKTALFSTWQWKVRFETAIENAINKSSRWVIDNRIFTIQSYERVGYNQMYYLFNLSEKE